MEGSITLSSTWFPPVRLRGGNFSIPVGGKYYIPADTDRKSFRERYLKPALADGLIDEGVEALVCGIPRAERTEVIKDLLEAKGLLVGSSTHNQRMLLNISAFMDDLKGLRFSHKIGAAFGSFGWGGGAVAQLEEDLRESGFDVMISEVGVRWAPDEEQLRKAREFGHRFAREVKLSQAEPVAAHHGTEA